jgi:hypothetical protein
MDNININSKGFNFEGFRLAKKYASSILKAKESDREYKEYMQNIIDDSIKRNKTIPDDKLNFKGLKNALLLAIKETKKEAKQIAFDLKRDDPKTRFSVSRNYETHITFFDKDGRNEFFKYYIEIDPNNILATELEKIKSDFITYLNNNPLNYMGISGFCFDGRIDVNYKTKDGYEDYEIGAYMDNAPTIWDTKNGWNNLK